MANVNLVLLSITIRLNHCKMSCKKHLFVLLLIMFFDNLCINAKIVKDTLFTADRDRIIITYDISHTDNQYTISFTNQQKKLGKINSGKYKDLDQIAVMFFDRTGGFGKDVSIANMVPDAFMVPSNVSYEYSSDGFFVVQSNPTLMFVSKNNSEINIPIYLAYHAKKGKYTLFSKCKGMKIRLSHALTSAHSGGPQIQQQTITSTMELEADNVAAIKVLESVKLSRELLAEANILPFSETLLDEIAYLRQQKRELTDQNLLSQINDVLDLYEETKSALEEKAKAEQTAAQQEAEAIAQREAEALQAKNDSIAAVQQMQAEKDKRRNMWMIIGGAILAILAFIGNQIFQSVRNSKNQRNMMNIQQGIANKAEAEAKKRARRAVRNATNRTVNRAKNEVRGAVREKMTIKVNGKSKNLSI